MADSLRNTARNRAILILKRVVDRFTMRQMSSSNLKVVLMLVSCSFHILCCVFRFHHSVAIEFSCSISRHRHRLTYGYAHNRVSGLTWFSSWGYQIVSTRIVESPRRIRSIFWISLIICLALGWARTNLLKFLMRRRLALAMIRTWSCGLRLRVGIFFLGRDFRNWTTSAIITTPVNSDKLHLLARPCQHWRRLSSGILLMMWRTWISFSVRFQRGRALILDI